MDNSKVSAVNSEVSNTVIIFDPYEAEVHFSVVWGDVCFVWVFFFFFGTLP